MRLIDVKPTVFFVRHGEGLRQLARLQMESDAAHAGVKLTLQARDIDETVVLGAVPEGALQPDVYLPDIREPGPVQVRLWVGSTLQDEKTIDWQPERHWEVYLVHYSHHDLGYTDLPMSVLREHASILDDVVRYADETKDWPEEDRFHWLVEQAWSVLQYVETRPPEAVERLVQAIRRGQVEVTALFGNQTTELCGHEELIRLLYPSFALKHRYGVDISSAEHNDIPGISWGLASTLAGAGIRHFSPGLPLWYFGQGDKRVHPFWDEAQVLDPAMPGAFWWQGIDGSRVLLWYDLHGMEWQPSSYEEVERDLPRMLGDLAQRSYPYDMVSYTLRGGHRDNAPATLRYAYIAREWNRRWAYPRFINANNRQFLERFEERWGSALRTLRGDVPGTDYAVAATCTPRETALNRNTHDELLTAEKLATLASLVAGYEYPRATLDEAYRNTFCFDEHCWGMAHAGGPAQDGCWSEKATFAYRAAALAHDVTVKAANRIADEIVYDQDAYYVTVLNPLSWERTDVVRIPLRAWRPCGQPMHWMAPRQQGDGPLLVPGGAVNRQIVEPPLELLEQPFELVDVGTGRPVAYQLARLDDHQAAQPWAAERAAMGQVDAGHLIDLVFVAEALPALGRKTYRIEPRAQWPAYAQPGRASAQTAENRFFGLELDPQTGAVASLVDRELGCDLVDPTAPHGFAQILARRCEGGTEAAGQLTELSLVTAGPVLTTLRARGSVAGCPSWTREITLYHELKRIDVNLRILRDSTPNLELYLAFPFQVETPRFRYEATGTVIEPLRDQLPGTNTDYYAVQHWVEVCGGETDLAWASVDAPIAEFGSLWPGYVSGAHHGVTPPGYGHPFLRPGELGKSRIYSMLAYNNFRTNFINVHPGEALFRYSIGSCGAGRPEGWAQQFGWNAASPPIAVWMKGPQAGRILPVGSFCRIDAPNVLLLTLKRAEDGNDLIARLVETEGRATKATLAWPLRSIVHAYRANLVEENEQLLAAEPHSVQVNMEPFATATVRLVLQ